MTSYIVLGKSKKKREDYIIRFCDDLAIDKIDRTWIGKETSKNQTSIGIDEVKRIQQQIFLKPIKSQNKAIVIDDADFLTTEAQNALLKILEEPPEQTIIILSAESKDKLLPTILSRCSIIELEREEIVISDEEAPSFYDFIKRLPVMSSGEKLKIAETQGAEKLKAIEWVEKTIVVLRDLLLENESDFEEIETIKKLQKLHTILTTTNVSPRFAIENTLLSV